MSCATYRLAPRLDFAQRLPVAAHAQVRGIQVRIGQQITVAQHVGSARFGCLLVALRGGRDDRAAGQQGDNVQQRLHAPKQAAEDQHLALAHIQRKIRLRSVTPRTKCCPSGVSGAAYPLPSWICLLYTSDAADE